MENSSKKLQDIMSQIQIIYMDSKQKITFEKKLENYEKANLYINEAVQLIEKLQNDINNINNTKTDPAQIARVNQFIDMLSMNNPKFEEVLYIVQQLRAINAGLPTTTQITDNVEQEIIYDEQ